MTAPKASNSLVTETNNSDMDEIQRMQKRIRGRRERKRE
jgi:hypothetical protein